MSEKLYQCEKAYICKSTNCFKIKPHKENVCCTQFMPCNAYKDRKGCGIIMVKCLLASEVEARNLDAKKDILFDAFRNNKKVKVIKTIRVPKQKISCIGYIQEISNRFRSMTKKKELLIIVESSEDNTDAAADSLSSWIANIEIELVEVEKVD